MYVVDCFDIHPLECCDGLLNRLGIQDFVILSQHEHQFHEIGGGT